MIIGETLIGIRLWVWKLDLRVDNEIRWGYRQLLHRVPYPTFLFWVQPQDTSFFLINVDHLSSRSRLRQRSCQCCGSALKWKVGSGSGIRIDLQMTSQNVWNMSLFEHFFKVLSLYLEARILIRTRIKVRGRIWIRIRIKGTSRIRISNKMIRIRNTVNCTMPSRGS